MENDKVVVLRARKGVPGIGRKIARYFDANEVTCGSRPKRKIRDGALVINYGRSQWPVWFHEAKEKGVRILNSPSAISICVNKLFALQVLSKNKVPHVEFTTDPQKVYDSLTTKFGIEWIARTTLTGKQGIGIIPVRGGTEYSIEGDIFPEAQLYTKFYPKTHEFRVHIVNGQVIDFVQKKRLGSKKCAARGVEVDDLIRNHKRGWVFAHNDLICATGGGYDEMATLAVSACNAIGIDFAGVDILAQYNEDGKFEDAVVCEVNSAPGMSSPTTFKRYMNAFTKLV